MYRFFVEKDQILEDSIVIKGQDVNHIKNVLRMKIGEKILISDGNDREYECEITSLADREVVAKIEDINGSSRELPIKVHLYQGIPKGDKMETIIQKMVELGGFRIVPVTTKRCVVKLDEKKAKNKVARWNAIAESAAKQSKRGVIPKVDNVMSFKEALKDASNLDVLFIPYEEAEDMEKTRNLIAHITPGQTIGIFIGPEGGFAPEEVEQAKSENISPITLGKRILRTETAGMALMSVLMFAMEE